MNRLQLMAALLATTSSSDSDWTITSPSGRNLPEPPPEPRRVYDVACPKCHAKSGEECDQRTLGRHLYHLARVKAAEQMNLELEK
jgi:hypothetical protein